LTGLKRPVFKKSPKTGRFARIFSLHPLSASLIIDNVFETSAPDERAVGALISMDGVVLASLSGG
jgi:hypothetical protein